MLRVAVAATNWTWPEPPMDDISTARRFETATELVRLTGNTARRATGSLVMNAVYAVPLGSTALISFWSALRRELAEGMEMIPLVS